MTSRGGATRARTVAPAGGPPPRVQFGLLGPLEATRAGAPVALGATRQRAVLALLLIHANEVVPAEQLIDSLWGAQPPSGAGHSVQVYVSGLRKVLEPERDAETPARVVVTQRPGYLVHVETEDLDASRFEALVRDGRAASSGGDPATASARLGEALGLWRGPALVDFAYEGFAQPEAARLEELRVGAVDDRLAAELALGHHTEIVGDLEAAARQHPLREHLWTLWMLALYRCGRQADALGAYRELANHLGEELGIAPSAELVALEEAVVLQKPELDWRPPSGAAATELPSGVVTFLMTDLEGSTRLWDEHPAAMRDALARHDELLRGAIEARDGQVLKATGDGVVAIFGRAGDALDAAVAAQRVLAAEPWDTTGPLRVRMGLHTGEAQRRGDDYFGPVLNRAARIMSAGHGGQILCSAATSALVPDALPEGVGLQDLGEHQLRDLDRPETIFQVTHSDLVASFASLRGIDQRAGRLPTPASSFVGRAREAAQVARSLEEARVVTLTGVGGVGKTRLALHVAREVANRFRDDVWWCELAPVRDHAGVADAVATLFSVTAGEHQTVEDALIDALRHKQPLLVLDNCEHLLEPSARLVETLQRSAPDLVVLATSREGLGVDGEQIVAVPSLTAPPEEASLDAIGSTDAVRLFVDRAAAVHSDFELGEENAAAVAKVCRRLDGVPLALELAAARVAAMTPAELAERLDRRFQMLAGGRRGAVERHQTLRAAIDWSYDLLDEPEQRLLARLAVFSGGFTGEAAETICGGDGIDRDLVFEHLANLVSRSLVVAEEHGAQTRYRLLETIRQYGEERLEENRETDALQARHAEHFTAYAEECFGHLHGPDHVRWAGRLDQEHDNLLTAWNFAIDTNDVDLAFRILCSAPRGHEGGYQLGLTGGAALTLRDASEHPAYPLALAITAVDAASRGSIELAEQRCVAALSADRRLHEHTDPDVENLVCQARADCAMVLAAFADAADLYRKAADIAQAQGNRLVRSVTLAFAAWSQALAGDAAGARPYARESVTLAREVGMPYAVTTCLLVLGITIADSDPEQARACLAESLDRIDALGYENINHLGTALALTAQVATPAATLEIARRALRHLQRVGEEGGWLILVLNVTARALVATRPDAAAVIQGCAYSRGRAAATSGADTSSSTPPPIPTRGSSLGYLGQLRRETTRELSAALGDDRLRQRWAEGNAMAYADVIAYTLSQTAALPPETDRRVPAT